MMPAKSNKSGKKTGRRRPPVSANGKAPKQSTKTTTGRTPAGRITPSAGKPTPINRTMSRATVAGTNRLVPPATARLVSPTPITPPVAPADIVIVPVAPPLGVCSILQPQDQGAMPLAYTGQVVVNVQGNQPLPSGYVTATPSDGSPSINKPIDPNSWVYDGAAQTQTGNFTYGNGDLPDDTACQVTATAFDDQNKLCLAGPITVSVTNT
jgi:hypothetical protein